MEVQKTQTQHAEKPKTQKQMLQWHPAFYAGIQIELEKEAQNLIFENEHQLGTKPKEIDVLIIKKENEIPIHTNIGRVFRKHNVVEYKSPTDYLSVDDFYRVYGYACFYKADNGKVNGIKIEDITITFVCHQYPKSLIQHLEIERNYKVGWKEAGIYYIYGDMIPIQLILTSELSEEKNFWLRNLTNDITKTEAMEKLIEEYEKHKNSGLYKAVMDIIVRANKKTFEEVKSMCEALKELMKDELDECRERGLREGLEQGIREGKQEAVKSIIEICQELGLSKENALQRVTEKLDMDEEKLANFFELYWR